MRLHRVLVRLPTRITAPILVGRRTRTPRRRPGAAQQDRSGPVRTFWPSSGGIPDRDEDTALAPMTPHLSHRITQHQRKRPKLAVLSPPQESFPLLLRPASTPHVIKYPKCLAVRGRAGRGARACGARACGARACGRAAERGARRPAGCGLRCYEISLADSTASLRKAIDWSKTSSVVCPARKSW
jgi:hypothetical protein